MTNIVSLDFSLDFEPEIGTTYNIDGTPLLCVECYTNCNDCFFMDPKYVCKNIRCHEDQRTIDRKSVILTKINK